MYCDEIYHSENPSSKVFVVRAADQIDTLWLLVVFCRRLFFLWGMMNGWLNIILNWRWHGFFYWFFIIMFLVIIGSSIAAGTTATTISTFFFWRTELLHSRSKRLKNWNTALFLDVICTGDFRYKGFKMTCPFFQLFQLFSFHPI